MSIQPQSLSERQETVQHVGILVSDYWSVLAKSGLPKDLVETLTIDIHHRLLSGDKYYKLMGIDFDEDDEEEEEIDE